MSILGNYTMENLKTQTLTKDHLLMLTKYHFGQNVQIKYKQNGLTSGWYLGNNNHSYYISKDAFSAALWLISSSPHFIEPNSFTTPVFSWINLGYQEYLNNVIAHQLIDQNECSTKPDNNIRSSAEYLDEILTNFKQMGGNNSALLVLIWTLGMPLKWFIGYYPKLILIGEEHGIFKVDKNALLNRIEKTVPGFLQREDDIPKILRCQSSFSSKEFSPETIKIELLKTTQPPPASINNWPVTEWLDFLCAINRSEFDDILEHCYQDYCHVTAPDTEFMPDRINNTIVMLLTWKLICLFLGRQLRWEHNGERVDDVDISIHSYI